MIYEKGKFYTLPIEKELSKGDYFVFRAERGNGSIDQATLYKLDFQKKDNYVMPASMLVRVRSIGPNGLPVLGHAIPNYVYDLYSDLYGRNGTIDCVVTGVPEDGGDGAYRIADDNGIIYRLNSDEGGLTPGEHIHCRFARLAPNYYILERVQEDTRFAFHNFGELMELAGVEKRVAKVLSHLFEVLPGLEGARRQEADGSGRWPLTATEAIRSHLDEWYMAARTRHQQRLHRALVGAMKKVLLYLLEGSTYLNGALRDARPGYRRLLTDLVDILEPYRHALALMEKGEVDDFVESIFDKLSISGYLYHPAVHFGTLTVIFRAYPEKVSYYLERIFESIFSRDLDNWQVDPFREAFVEQFEIYISQARRAVDALPLAETRAQKATLQTLIVSIAMQMLLASGNKIPAQNHSLYYRCISLLRPLGSEALLFKALLSVLKIPVRATPRYSSLREPMMMMTEAAVPVGGGMESNIRSAHTYSGAGMTLRIDSTGVSLSRQGTDTDGAGVCGTAMLPWLAPRIYVPGIRPMSAARKKKLSDHHSWWQEVETALTAPVQSRVEEDPMRAASVGDYAYIVVDNISEAYDNDPLFNCRIVSTEFFEARGTMRRSDIVDYNLRYPGADSFSGRDGQPLAFYAKVTGRDENGDYKFSLREEVDGYIRRTIGFDSIYTAVITGVNAGGYSAIGSDGFGLYLDDAGRDLPNGAIVGYRLKSGHSQGNIHGIITGREDDTNRHFDKTRAFANLMHAIGEETGGVDTPDGSGNNDADAIYDEGRETLTAADVSEIASIVRFKALSETDIITAYDYLRFGRLLALAAGDTALADTLGAHAALLIQFQYYAVNNTVDARALSEIKERSEDSPLLRTITRRLEIACLLGDSRANGILAREIEAPAGELECSLAKIVLSYNMMADIDAGAEVLDGIREQLKARLNMNTEAKAAKYYGSESKYLEFKTSIVFPASNTGTEAREAPEEQQAHIMSRVAGLLNASGGKLYIGVSNDGYAVGMHDDFKYFERHKARLGSRYFDIRNTDNLCVFLENLIHETFGPTVARKIEVSADDDTDKAVVLISVRESLEPVFIDGRLYVRQSGQSTREYRDRALEEFVAERVRERAEREHVLNANREEAKTEQAETEKVIPAAADNSVAAAPVVEAEEVKAAAASKVATSRWMPNVLHEYDDGYVAPDGYLYFTGESTVEYSRTDLHIDYSDDCRCALAIGHEYAGGYLVMGYEDGKVVKVPLDEIYEKGENTPMAHNADSALQFAAIANADDIVVCVVADNSDALWRRSIRVSDLDNGHIGSAPRRFHESPVSRSVRWEIADGTKAPAFAESMADRLSARKVGVALRARLGDDVYEERLETLTDMCSNRQ